MRVLMVTLTAMTLLLVTGRAEALKGEGEPKGDEFLRQKKPKVAKDYYVVPTGQSHQCSIVAGEWEKKPARSALSHMQVQTMRRQRSKHFPNARVGSRTRRRTRRRIKNIGKNENAALARLVRAIGWGIGGFVS